MFYEVPLTVDPDQNFRCTIPINNKNLYLSFRVRYNTIAKYWTIAVTDSTGNILLDNIPLVTGVDLLGQFKYLGLGSAVIINTGNTSTDSPDDTSLGANFVLTWGDSIG